MSPAPTRVSEISPHRGASQLVVVHDRAAYLATDKLAITNLATKQKVVVAITDAHALGALGDDIAVATNALGTAKLVRFAAGDSKGRSLDGVMSVPNTGYGSVFPAAKPNELYLGGPRIALERSRIDADRVVPIQTVEWTRDEQATFSAAGPGRVAFIQGDEIVRIGPDAARAAFHLPAAWVAPVHLAAGPTLDTMWLTDGDKLGLVSVAHDKATVTHTVELHATAFAIASASDFVAIVQITGDASKLAAEVVVIDANGAVRWRAQLPGNQPRIELAASSQYVAVTVGGELHAWAAKDGAVVLP